MDPVYDKKVGAYVLKWPVRFNFYVPGRFASWPFSRLKLFRKYLVISILGKDFTIKYKDIDFIEKKFFRIVIHHHAKSIDKYVYLGGSGTGKFLFKEIKDVIQKNKLPIKIK